jgi:hypothetical protein
MGLRAWYRLETRVSELEAAWEEKVGELTRLAQRLEKRDQRAAARTPTPEQPLSGGGEVDPPQVARYRALRAWRSAKGM